MTEPTDPQTADTSHLDDAAEALKASRAKGVFKKLEGHQKLADRLDKVLAVATPLEGGEMVVDLSKLNKKMQAFATELVAACGAERYTVDGKVQTGQFVFDKEAIELLRDFSKAQGVHGERTRESFGSGLSQLLDLAILRTGQGINLTVGNLGRMFGTVVNNAGAALETVSLGQNRENVKGLESQVSAAVVAAVGEEAAQKAGYTQANSATESESRGPIRSIARAMQSVNPDFIVDAVVANMTNPARARLGVEAVERGLEKAGDQAIDAAVASATTGKEMKDAVETHNTLATQAEGVGAKTAKEVLNAAANASKTTEIAIQ